MSKRRILLGVLCGTIGFCVIGEFVARFGYGLGDPPLSEASADLDYIFKPNQRCNRFGNRICYNNMSMRCDFDVFENDRTRRLFVVGDSVVNGGALTDQDALATSILQHRMSEWQVCNVSAGSWGPGNAAAYFRRYPDLVRVGDALVLQVNGHDLWEDDPREGAGRIVGQSVSFPSTRPWCALWDGWTRYAWPRMKARIAKPKTERKIDVCHAEKDISSPRAKFNLACCEYLYSLPFGAKYLLVFRSRAETREARESEGERAFVEHARARGVNVIYAKLNADEDFRDSIHPNESGQGKMADLILTSLEGACD